MQVVSLRRTYTLTLLAGLVMQGLIIYGYYNGERLNERVSPLMAAVQEIRLEVGSAQHEITDIVSGRTAPHGNPWLYLDQAIWYLKNLIETSQSDGALTFGSESGLPADDPIERTQQSVAVLKDYLARQTIIPESPEELAQLQESYSSLFGAVFDGIDKIEARISRLIHRDRALFRYTHLGLILVCAAMMVAVAFTIRRYERHRSDDYVALNNINTMLASQVAQREKAEKALQAAYKELEDRVLERTHELFRINQDLKAEVDERRRTEDHLRESRNALQTVIDGIKDALILVDKDMRVKMLNRGAEAILGVASAQEVIGQYCFNLGGACHIRACDECRIPQAVLDGRELTFQRPIGQDGEGLEQVSVYPVWQKGRQSSGAILRITDITEEKRLERQLIRSEKMASLGLLVSSIAHEINNPNNFVTFNIPILRDYLSGLIRISDEYAESNPDLELFHMTYPEFRKDIFNLVDNIEHGAGRISAFVSNLRDFSQNNGRQHRVWLDLSSVVEKVLSICRVQIKKNVKTFSMDVPAKLPSVYVDLYSLEQVLLNLIVNAVQAVDKEDSFVRVAAASGDSWQAHTIITVTDNGCGMDSKTMGRIFDPFFTTKSDSEGTGLGLYVCHNLVQRLGGRIEVDSRPGAGSIFTVYLPDKDRRKVARSPAVRGLTEWRQNKLILNDCHPQQHQVHLNGIADGR